MKALILPGLGTDARMYAAGAYASLEGVEFVDWPAYRGETGLEAVARRVIDGYALDAETAVGGSSLGGMIAAEIARQVPVRKVLLIGSAPHPSAVNPSLKTLSAGADFIPTPLLQTILYTLDPGQQNSLLAMFRRADPAFIKAMAKAIFHWAGADPPPCPAARIHGALDGVIFPPATGAEIIPDGGHLIAMTHAARVAEFIRRETA